MFGSQSTGFGQPKQSTGFGSTTGSTGFGTSTGTTGFGTSTGFGQPKQSTGFGTTTGTTGFGTSTGTSSFGQPKQSTGFGTTTGTTGFGTSTGTTGFGTSTGFGQPKQSTGFGTTTGTTGFGTSTGTTGFGQKPTTGFGTTTGTTGFGTSTGTTGFGQKPTTGFGTTTGTTGFGVQQQQQPPSDVVIDRLPQQYKQTIDQIYNKFNENEKIKEDIEIRSTEAMDNVEKTSKIVEEKLAELSGILNVDIQNSAKQKKEYMDLVRKAENLSDLVEKIDKQMSSTETYLWNYQVSNLPTDYFKELLVDFENKMNMYRKSIESIEAYIDSNAQSKSVYSPEVLQDVMKHQMELFISLASQVGQIHERIEDLSRSRDY